jgi:uncharacterized membrane protein
MNKFLTYAFLFFIGSLFGWVLELLFRRFISSSNPERKWINPGFCIGPYLPLYGVGLCVLYLISDFESKIEINNIILSKIVLFLSMAIAMTVIEYIAGIISLKVLNVRLWDYSKEWLNLNGIICPKFSLAWALLGTAYYYLINPHILNAIDWLSQNLAFSFIIGFFFGVFIIDVAYSSKLIIKIKKYAKDNDVIVRYENLKANLRKIHENNSRKTHFFFSLYSETPLVEHLKELRETFESKNRKKK